MKQFLVALALMITPCEAQTTIVNTPIGTDAWIIPAAGGTTLYGATDPTDTYGIAQWNQSVGQVDLTSFSLVACTSQFVTFTNCIQATSPNITVTSYLGTDGNQWIDLQSTGVGVTCPLELDSLHQANSSVYSKYPQAVVGRANNLSTISHLYAAFKAEPVAFTTVDTNCGTMAVGMMFEAGFNNTISSQTLFYQLNLYRYPSPAGAGFFANTNPYGYRDVMANYGKSPLTVGVIADFTGGNALDFLARIKTIISGASNGLDTDITHWNYIGGHYEGHNTFGDTTGETAFCCSALTVTSAPVGRPLSWHR